jgi:cysteine desulfurase family protein
MIYLDHAATSWPKPETVGEAIAASLAEPLANPGRGFHTGAMRSARLVFETRDTLARLLNAPRTQDVVFTRGTTEGLNLVLKGFLKPGARVWVSPLEHNALLRPLARLAAERGVQVETLDADSWGRLDLDALSRRIQTEPEPALVAVAHASNVNGAVQDLRGIREAIGKGVPLLVDAAQTAGVLPLDGRAPEIDLLAFSAHKGLLGPTGIGGCYLSPKHEVTQLIEGGTGSLSESAEHPAQRPDRYEAGTLNLHGIAGLKGALDGFPERGLLGEHKRAMTQIILEGLRGIEGVRVVSPLDGTALLASFVAEGIAPNALAERLDEEYGILCRSGLHCAPAAHRHLGTFPEGTARFSPGWGTTEADCRTALDAVRAIIEKK